MKTIVLTLATICALGFSSCKKCQICTKSNADEIRVCESDYNSNTEYGLAIDAREFAGYECK